MFEDTPNFRVGTSSWSSKDWVGDFYPQGTAPAQFIEHYSTVYDTVELDASFYRMPTEVNVAAWKRRTPEGFIFSAKTPRSITHDKVLQGDSVEEMHAFIEIMQGLGTRMGPLLLQFPYFNRSAFAEVRPFLDRLDTFLEKLPREPRYVVEVRNPRWVGSALQDVCARHRVAMAWVAQAWMPRGPEYLRRLGKPSCDFAYVRFLGDHKGIEKITKKWDRLVVDPAPELSQWIPVLEELQKQGVDVFAYFNNHFAGNAPRTIELFRNLWRARTDSPSGE